MIESGYYPIGAENDTAAPWNQKELPNKEIEVLVSITLSKSVKIKVSDYVITEVGKDEDGDYFEDIDYSDCDLKGAVEEQILLPHQLNTACSLPGMHIPPDVKEDFDGWNVDELEVILE